MKTLIPADAPIDDAAREKLRELGIVSLEQAAGVAAAAPHRLSELIGPDNALRFRAYVANLPLPIRADDDATPFKFSLGARLDEPAVSSGMTAEARRFRDQLFDEAQKCRARGDFVKAVELEAELEQWVLKQRE